MSLPHRLDPVARQEGTGRRRRRPAANTLAAMLAAAASAPAAAHHSYAQFDRCTSVTIEGAIDEILWGGPHIVLTVGTDDAEYRVEWFHLAQLRRLGFSSDVLRRGDRVAITGAAHRDPAVKALALVTEIRRERPGWSWSRSVRRPADCA